jgi:hypothetical protein
MAHPSDCGTKLKSREARYSVAIEDRAAMTLASLEGRF